MMVGLSSAEDADQMAVAVARRCDDCGGAFATTSLIALRLGRWDLH